MKKIFLLFLSISLLFNPINAFAEEKDDDEENTKNIIAFEQMGYVSSSVEPIGNIKKEDKNIDTNEFDLLVDGIDDSTEQIINDKEEFEKEEIRKKQEEAIKNSGSSTIVVREPYNLNDEDIKIIASVVYGEAGNQSYEGKLAVANIILNRLDNGYWGSTISDVVYSPYQFCAVEGHWFSDAMANGPNEDCMKAAEDAVSGLNNIGSYLSFRTTAIAEYDSYSSYIIIGDHVFY